MNKKLLSMALVLSSLVLAGNANAFYVGGSLGQSKTKLDGFNVDMDAKTAFSLSAGMELPLPLIPLRAEVEYLHLNSSKDGVDGETYGAGVNAYVGLPLLPIIKPYVGFGLGYLQQEVETRDAMGEDIKNSSDWTLTPQYMLGLDVSLPLLPIAGGVEYRYIDTEFDGFTGDQSSKSKIHTFLVKARYKF